MIGTNLKAAVSQRLSFVDILALLYYYIKHKCQWGECMFEIDRIMQLAQENNGTVTSEMVTKAGLSRGILKYLCDQGRLERSGRGVYILPEIWDDEMFNLQIRYKRGIFSHDTALFLWGLTDRTPSRYCMTFPAAYNTSNIKKENIRFYKSVEGLYELGVTQISTPAQNTVRVYSRERTLCDILRKGSQTDIQLVTQGFKEYVKLPDKNITLLSEYSKRLRVSDKVRSYLEVLL